MDENPFPESGVSGPLTLEEHYLLLMAPMDRCLRAIIEERVLPEPRERTTINALGARFGVRPERLRQLETSIRASVADIAAFHAAPLVDRAQALAVELGPRAPLDSQRTRRALSCALADVSPARVPTLRRLLLRVAGYTTKDGWLVRVGAAPSSVAKVPTLAEALSPRGASEASARGRAPR